jgi:MFS family permease
MRSKPVILVALLLAAFLVNLETTMVNVALPALVRELHATTTQLQWVVDAYNVVFAALLLTFGSLSDRFGRKRMLLAGLAVFGTASLAGGFATTPAQLIAARSVMGLGAAMTFPATLSLISNVFTGRRERARAIGLWGASAGVAIATGPIVGGWLLEHYSWAAVFIAMAPVAAAAVVLAALVVPASKDPGAAAVDIPGLVLSSAAMALLVFTIIEAPAYGWTSGRSLAGFAGSAVLLAAFIIRERRAAHPMLDVRLFRNMRFSAASSAVTVSFFTLFGFIFLITLYFQFVRGYGPLSAGCACSRWRCRSPPDRSPAPSWPSGPGPSWSSPPGWSRWPGSTAGSRRPSAPRSPTHHRGPDGGLRARPGPDLGAGHRVHHGRRPAGQGRRRLGHQRLHQAHRRHPRRGRDRQRLRLGLRSPAHRRPARGPARPGRRRRPPVRRRGLRGRRPAHRPRPPRPRPGAAARLDQPFLRGLTIGALVAGGVAAFGALLAVLFLPAQPATPAAYQAETAGQAHDSQTHTRPSTTATSRRPEITHATQAGTTCWSIWPRPGLAGPPRPRPGRCAYEARWHSCHHPGRRRAVLSCVLPGRLR